LDYTQFDFLQNRDLLLNKETRCQDLVEQYLQNMNKGAHLNAFISIMQDQAREQAARVDQKIARGKIGALAGLVLGVKDLITIEGFRTTCGSKILHNFVAPYTATAVQRLLDQDAIVIGKTNLDEFAMGSSSETSYFGAVKNPVDENRVAGGSSGGSAAAVAANQCMAALGTDTGGSIRQPASFCGVVGLKPTYGRVSRFGLVAYASSFDQIGPLSRSVRDSAALMNILAGYDPMDSTSANVAVPNYLHALDKKVKGLVIGLPKEYFSQGLDEQVKQSIDATARQLQSAGAIIKSVSLPHTEYAIAAYYILATAEASANLERYDGVRYGHRDTQAANLEDMYEKTRSQGFGQEVKRRIMLGTFVLSSGYYDAYYLKAQKARTLIKQDFERVLNRVDCLLTPTAPTVAFRQGEKTDDPLQMYLSDVYTVSVNLAGLPGISVPCGKNDQGLPIGAQLVGRPFDEETLLRIADWIESNQNLMTNRMDTENESIL
jgi:aspartyl-tRNA(Asn)/glutamyl-tRNA(Gln) amidotransferase subunit A